MKKRIAFIGSGKMAEALLSGILSSKLFNKKNIIISDKDSSRAYFVSKKYEVHKVINNLDAAKEADIIVLSVKPANIFEVISDILPVVTKSKIIISIAAGVKISSIQKKILLAPTIRAMPNTPCLLGHGMTAVCAGKNASKRDLNIAISIFSSVGHVIRVQEKLMDVVTALSGSGPAFVYAFVGALIDGGIKCGLSATQAKTLAFETLIGAGFMLKRSGASPDELISMVSSPGGTTIAGLSVLGKRGFNDIVSNAIIKACKRSVEISKEFEAK